MTKDDLISGAQPTKKDGDFADDDKIPILIERLQTMTGNPQQLKHYRTG
jgi:hypothetical protein